MTYSSTPGASPTCRVASISRPMISMVVKKNCSGLTRTLLTHSTHTKGARRERERERERERKRERREKESGEKRENREPARCRVKERGKRTHPARSDS